MSLLLTRFFFVIPAILSGVLFLLGITLLPSRSLAVSCDVGGVNETSAQLEERLKICENEIKLQNSLISVTAEQAASLKRDITLLKSKIDKAKLEIKKRDVAIKQLDGGIQEKQKEISALEQKTARMQTALGKLVRETREVESATMYQVLLSDQNISSFFLDVDNFEVLQGSLKDLFGEVREARAETEDHKAVLQTKKQKEAELKAAKLIEQKKTQVLQSEKDRVLTETKGQEALYKKILSQKQQVAAEIKNRILKLTGGGQLKFGDALQLARIPEQKVGVRAAFLLAILTQESGMNGIIGSNLGRCFYNTSWKTPNGTVMSTTQKPSFLALMEYLEKDPNTTPVSCPISRDGTYGGAMGPSQFMPTTWWDVEKGTGYKKRVEEVTGSTAASPFDNLSAFTGTALYLSDGLVGCRATYPTQYNQEACAAAKYYAGGNWKKYMKSYGAQVANRAEEFQKDIDILDAQ